jgi:hypothetical protein
MLHGFEAELAQRCMEFARGLALPGCGELGAMELSSVEESYVRRCFAEAFESEGEVTRWLVERN